ncbi:MAG: hypothetical protein DI598_16775 [Pseudopedobacter saltans]|uniref:Prohead serine protease domain-containing protein n=1 Tax=Pseudopedobacter saltans TaxID=151895 RepID=A0A2W5EM21_9SPHI|nr:MAG: hypothetical protein DI598_16775 [Pseudopedobacter saltans]
MAFKKTFVISDETVNSHGFVTKTSGIDLSIAKVNCPAFYDHRTWETPIGHWENFRVENNRLLGDVVIEGADDREKEYVRKIENGDIKGASFGADPYQWNDDPLQLTAGQTSPTLEKCQIFEVSITPLPANTACIALKKDGNVITLNANAQNNIVPSLKKEIDMKSIALKLGLSENATESEILAELGKVQLAKKNAETIAENVLAKAGEGLEESQKETYVILSKANPEHAIKFAEKCKAENIAATAEPIQSDTVKLHKDVKVSDLIRKQGTKVEKEMSFDQLRKTNPVELARIKKEEPEKYDQLVKAYANGVRYNP